MIIQSVDDELIQKDTNMRSKSQKESFHESSSSKSLQTDVLSAHWEIRCTIEDKLAIKSVFPNSYPRINMNHVSCRCMLARKEGDEAHNQLDRFFEDVLVSFRSNAQIVTSSGENISVGQVLESLFRLLYWEGTVQYSTANLLDNSFKCFLRPRLKSNAIHPSLNPIFLMLQESIDQNHNDSVITDTKKIILCQDYGKYSILSISRFYAKTTLLLPSLARCGGQGSKDIRLRFIIYQLLQAVAFLHSQNIVLDEFSSSSVHVDDNLWITLPMSLSNRCCWSAMNKLNISNDNLPQGLKNQSHSYIPKFIDFDVPLTNQWIDGKISNFEYLMAVNQAAGRTLIDPLYHPIIPWVTDFSTEFPSLNRGLRDLTMTKFRLSKGDPQLETTYKHSDPPHHIPESLSELTYYIYLARRTPLHVLRRVVRDVFVPEHYPSSMSRMYEWTPDECIPEFYTDPTVFESIHKSINLSDLELPSFVSSAEDFISYHRRIFESDEVSAYLHHWIDLTFGYCLEGYPAVYNMNVPLKHTLNGSERVGESVSLDKHPGFCILFKEPHPGKKSFKSVHYFDRKSKSKITSSKSPLKSKQFTPHNTASSRSSALSSDLDALVNLDNRTANVKTKRKHEKKINSLESMSIGGTSNISVSSNVQTRGANSTHSLVPRVHSLVNAYDALPSWAVLELAEDVDISNEESCKTSRDLLDTSLRDYSFGEKYCSLLNPAYALPPEEVFAALSDEERTTLSSIKKGIQKEIQESKDVRFWDHEFLRALKDLRNNLNRKDPKVTNSMDKLRSEDMFAIGCIIGELFIGKPILSTKDALKLKIMSETSSDYKLLTSHIMKIIYSSSSTSAQASTSDNVQQSHSNDIPLTICRLISLLLQSDTNMRPSAAEILQACTAFDIDMWSKNDVGNLRTGGFKPGYVDFVGYSSDASDALSSAPSKIRRIDDQQNILPPSGRLDLIDLFCKPIFPAYFRIVYCIISSMKLSPDGHERFLTLTQHFSDIFNLPLEGLSLILPHVLEVISDSTPFRKLFEENNSSNSQGDLKDGNSSKLSLLSKYSGIIDIIGMRFGMETTEKIVIPRVTDFLNSLNSPTCLQAFLSTTTLWHVLIIRGGVKSFLRYILPLLMTYLSSGILQNISHRTPVSENSDLSRLNYSDLSSVVNPISGGVPPLWATMGITDKTEWLHLCKKSELKTIQQNAVLAISSLVDPGALGPGLSTRFIVPPLMSLIGSPQFTIASLNTHIGKSATIKTDWNRHRDSYYESIRAEEGVTDTKQLEVIRKNSRDIAKRLEELLYECSTEDYQDIFTVHAVVAICSHLGDHMTSELVLTRIFDEILPQLEPLLSVLVPAPGTISALMEIVLLLNGILPNLSVDTVLKYYIQQNRQNSITLPELLTIMPLSNLFILGDDISSRKEIGDIELYLESDRRFSLLFELVRLIVSASMIVGSACCIEQVLPHVDRFFGNFVDEFGKEPVQSQLMMKAFELGAELYLPLENITGVAFSSTVPNLNPRLELWLGTIGSGSMTRSSPPLPGNIFPEAVLDHTNPEGKKKKGMFSGWMNTSATGSTTSMTFSLSSKAPPSMIGSSSSSSKGKSSNTSIKGTSKQDITNTGWENMYDHRAGYTANAPVSRGVSDQDVAELSPVSNQVMHSHHASSTYSIRTPFSKLVSGTGKTVVDGDSAQSAHSMTEGMELQAIDRGNYINSPMAGISLNFNSSFVGDSSYDLNNSVVRNIRDSDDEEASFLYTEYTSLVESRLDGVSETGDNSNGSKPKEQYQGQLKLDNNPSPMNTRHSKNHDHSDSPINDDNPPTSSSTETLTNPIVSEESFKIPSIFYKSLLGGKYNHESNRGQLRDVAVFTDSSANVLRKRINSINSNPRVGGPGAYRHSELEAENDDEYGKDNYYNDVVWLLAGYGKWNNSLTASNDSLMSPVPSSGMKGFAAQVSGSSIASTLANAYNHTLGNTSNSNATVGTTFNNTSSSSNTTQNRGKSRPFFASNIAFSSNVPSAQVSMTAPRIAVDAAAEAGSFFSLSMIAATQFRVDDAIGLTGNNINASNSVGSVRYLTTNPTESLLVSCSRSGTKLWSLNCHPIIQVANYYNSSSTTPFVASFLRDGAHIATCDGTVNIWDIEKSRPVAFIGGSPLQSPFHSMTVISSRHGISPSIQPMGDDQLLTSSSNFVLSHYDYRSNSKMNNLRAVSEWHLPGLPSLPTNQMSSFTASNPTSDIVSNHISCAISCENYVVAGSNQGGLWMVDRRMGRSISSWQPHDSCVIKIAPLDESHFISVAERTAYVWSLKASQTEPVKMISLKNMPDSTSSPLTASTTIITAFDSMNSSNANGYFSPDIRSNHRLHVFYGVSGHKMYGGRIKSSFDFAPNGYRDRYSSALGGGLSIREPSECEEVKLMQSYFTDRNRNKISKTKLNATSAVLLPLRRLLLVASDDGVIRVVS